MTDAQRAPRTLRATPEVTGPEGSFELGESYTCAVCHNVFEKGQSDDAAIEEFMEVFGRAPLADDGLVCDECYQKVMAWRESLCAAEKMGYLCVRRRDPEVIAAIEEMLRAEVISEQEAAAMPCHDMPHAGWTSRGMVAFWDNTPTGGPGVRVRALDDAALRTIREELEESLASAEEAKESPL